MMDPTHAQVKELASAYLLGALDESERAQVETHLLGCPDCAAELQSLGPAVEALALAVPPRDPPARARYRLLQSTQAQPLSEPARSIPLAFLSRWLTPRALAGAALALVALIGFWTIQQQQQLQSDLASERDYMTVLAYSEGPALSIHGSASAPLAYGKLYADPDDTVAALVTIGLPQIDAAHEYQVWLTEASGVSTLVGSFAPDPQGRGWLLVRSPQALSHYQTVSVTLQNKGTARPEGLEILKAALP